MRWVCQRTQSRLGFSDFSVTVVIVVVVVVVRNMVVVMKVREICETDVVIVTTVGFGIVEVGRRILLLARRV